MQHRDIENMIEELDSLKRQNIEEEERQEEVIRQNAELRSKIQEKSSEII